MEEKRDGVQETQVLKGEQVRTILVPDATKREYDKLLARCLYDAWWLRDARMFRRITWLITHTRWTMPNERSINCHRVLQPIYQDGGLGLLEEDASFRTLPGSYECMLVTLHPVYQYLCHQLSDAYKNGAYHLDKESERDKLNGLIELDLQYLQRLESIRNRYRPENKGRKLLYSSSKYDLFIDDLLDEFQEFRSMVEERCRAIQEKAEAVKRLEGKMAEFKQVMSDAERALEQRRDELADEVSKPTK